MLLALPGEPAFGTSDVEFGKANPEEPAAPTQKRSTEYLYVQITSTALCQRRMKRLIAGRASRCVRHASRTDRCLAGGDQSHRPNTCLIVSKSATARNLLSIPRRAGRFLQRRLPRGWAESRELQRSGAIWLLGSVEGRRKKT